MAYKNQNIHHVFFMLLKYKLMAHLDFILQFYVVQQISFF